MPIGGYSRLPSGRTPVVITCLMAPSDQPPSAVGVMLGAPLLPQGPVKAMPPAPSLLARSGTPCGPVALNKSHALKPITTRKYPAGWHAVQVQIDGRVVAESGFGLQL